MPVDVLATFPPVVDLNQARDGVINFLKINVPGDPLPVQSTQLRNVILQTPIAPFPTQNPAPDFGVVLSPVGPEPSAPPQPQQQPAVVGNGFAGALRRAVRSNREAMFAQALRGPSRILMRGASRATTFLRRLSYIEADDLAFAEELVTYTSARLNELRSSKEEGARMEARGVVSSSLDTLMMMTKRYFAQHLRFVTQEFRQFLRFRTRFPRGDAIASMNPGVVPVEALREFDARVTELRDAGSEHLARVKDVLEQRFGPAVYMDFFDFVPDAQEVGDRRIEIYESMDRATDKIYLLYENSVSIMDVIMDTQFFAMYVLKALRIACVYASLILVQRLFEEMYIKTVYTDGKPPPSLARMIFLFVGVELVFNVFILVALGFLIVLAINIPGFVVDTVLVGKYVVDYALTTIIIVALGLVVARVVQRKKYFKYKLEGLRAVRAFRDMMFAIAAVVILFPMFMLF